MSDLTHLSPARLEATVRYALRELQEKHRRQADYLNILGCLTEINVDPDTYDGPITVDVSGADQHIQLMQIGALLLQHCPCYFQSIIEQSTKKGDYLVWSPEHSKPDV